MPGTGFELLAALLRTSLLIFGAVVLVASLIRYGTSYYRAARRWWEQYLRAYWEKQREDKG